MDSDTVTDLLLQYINSHRKFIPISVRSYLRENNISIYRFIQIEYNNTIVEIKIYNPYFITFNVDNYPKNVSCNLTQARDAIDAIFSRAHH